MKVVRFKPSQKIRVVSGSASFYTTVKQIRSGVGGLGDFNAACQKAVDSLEFTRSGKGIADQCTSGILGTWEGIVVQVDMA